MTTPTRPRPLLIAERFGPTLQGEGPSTGQQALFIRLSRCNLSCAACDTPYTWDWSRFDPRTESHKATHDELLDWVVSQTARLVVITGGEPLLQQDSLTPLVEDFVAAGRRVEIETNGTIQPHTALIDSVTQFNVSPKTANFEGSRPETARINNGALETFLSSGKAVFKFVATNQDDLTQIAYWEKTLGLTPIWIMPEGTSSEAVLSGMAWLAEEATARNWHLSTRLHVLIWGDRRGR